MSNYLKSFQYTNSKGYRKELTVYEKVDGKYPVTLWSLDTGDFCGSGNMTTQELNDYLKHFVIEEEVE